VAKSNAKNDRFFSRGRVLTILIVSVILSLLIIPRMVSAINEGLLAEILIFETDISEKPDGEYLGSYATSGYAASVSVTVYSGRIGQIEIISLAKLNPTRMSQIAEKVVRYQMLTFEEPGWDEQPADRVFLKAIENALTGSSVAAAM